jgi:pilus assembly protein CpaC
VQEVSAESYEVAGGPNVINLLRIPGEEQVMLKVTVAEVNRAATRSIGLNFSVLNEKGMTVFTSTVGNIVSATTGGTGVGSGFASGMGSAANLNALFDGGQVALAINALRTLDMARTLAEPNLTALNGQTARFQAGGEFPVPVVTGFTAAGLQGVSFVPFGVQLSFTPSITDKDRVRLVVNADVSTRDLSASATVNGTTVPGLNTRNFQTTVELRGGQTLAVAGLLQSNFGFDATRVPFFGDLPLIGRLFAFDRTASGEQELVVLVTPVLVHPLEHNELPALPGSDVFEPDDIEFYLLGRLENRRTQDYRTSVRTDIQRMIRYHHGADLYIVGPQGHSDGH